MHDLLEVGDSMIYPGDGAAQIRVTFRMVVFRPLPGEILQGRIRSCSEKGLFITMGFFEDIVVPPAEMQPDTHFDQKEQLWVWKYGDAELFMEIDEVVHFRVVRGDFYDITPGAALTGEVETEKELQSPFVLTVRLPPSLCAQAPMRRRIRESILPCTSSVVATAPPISLRMLLALM